MSYDPATRCNMCHNEGTQLCGGCRTRYCSHECFNADAPVHNLLCKIYSDITSQPRPRDTDDIKFHLAFLFDIKKSLPQLIWAPFKVHRQPHQFAEEFMARKFLGDAGRLKMKGTDRNILQGGLLHARKIYVWSGDWTKLNKEPISQVVRTRYTMDTMEAANAENRAVRSLNPHRSQAMTWRTTVVAVNMLQRLPSRYSDVTMPDLRLLADYFAICTMHKEAIDLYQTVEWMDPPIDHPSVVGVRIFCDHSVQKLGRKRFVPWDVLDNGIIYRAATSMVSDMIGLSVFMKQVPLRSYNAIFRLRIDVEDENESLLNGESPLASAMKVGAQVNPPPATNGQPGEVGQWGRIASYWSGEIGDCVVVRADRKPLLPEHCEALATFSWGLWYKMHKIRQINDIDEQNRQVLAFRKEVTRAKFEMFWKAYSRKKKWNVESPYDM